MIQEGRVAGALPCDVQLIRTRLLNALGCPPRVLMLETTIASLMVGRETIGFGTEMLAEMLGYHNRKTITRILDESFSWQESANVRLCDVVRGTRNVHQVTQFTSNRLNAAAFHILALLERDADNQVPVVAQIDCYREAAVQRFLRRPLKVAGSTTKKTTEQLRTATRKHRDAGDVISWDFFDTWPDVLNRAAVRIFPVDVERKKPRITGYHQYATRGLRVISEWSRRWPETAWGALCGVRLVDGKFVVAIDKDRHGDAFGNGFKTVALRERDLGPLPDTFTVSTPQNGEHCYFWTSIRLPTWVGRLGPGLDCKGVMGFVIAPGSPGYTVTRDLPIADLPTSWQEALNVVNLPKQKTPIGERHNYLGRVAYAMACQGKNLDQILMTLSGRLLLNCESGGRLITEKELKELAVSALAKIDRANEMLDVIVA